LPNKSDTEGSTTVRLSEAKIKETILHPEKLARHEALLYFTDCFSPDPEVMPLAIQAIERYGRRGTFRYVHLLADLAQTQATVEWAIRDLHREEEQAEDRDTYFPALSRLLCNADPKLLLPREQEILQAPGFLKDLTFEFQERLELLTWDADSCWKELEHICQEAVKPDMADVDLGHAHRVVEALARKGEKYTDQILELLGQKVTDFENDPMTWMESFLVELVGEMRLERAIPQIVGKLHEMGDVVAEECVDALGQIGTDAAAEAVAEGWLATNWDYRLYATSALEKIHSDTTVRKCLELLPQDKDLDIRTKLADALLAQFPEEGIEPVREMVQRRAYDADSLDLPARLVAVSTVMGVSFPELPVWKREVEEKQAQSERRMREMWGPRQSAVRPAPEPREDYVDRKPTPFLRQEQKVGRNDQCPCGSGKKFKKCCLNKK
jgi:hypothetical protein